MSVLSESNFKSMLLGESTVNERNKNLYEQLKQYYQDTKDLSPIAAHSYWKRFKEWADINGYTREEILLNLLLQKIISIKYY